MNTSTLTGVIPFYGGQNAEMFEIERRCMDRTGHVIRYLDEHIPTGMILDIGAGNGWTAERLTTTKRHVIAMEPDPAMIDRSKRLIWCHGVAQQIPFHAHSMDGVYSTWAFFLPGVADREKGLREVVRVAKPNAPILFVDNAGQDEFSRYAQRPIADEGEWYIQRGFTRTLLQSAFVFDSVEEARSLLTFYFGEEVRAQVDRVEIEFNIAVYKATPETIQFNS